MSEIDVLKLDEQLDNYRNRLQELFQTSQFLESDSEEEKIRILTSMKPPINHLALYKYYKLDVDGYVLYAIRNNMITLTSPSLFNDPYDSLLYVNRDAVRAAQKEIPPQKIIEFINARKNGMDLGSKHLNLICDSFRKIPEEKIQEILLSDEMTIDRNTSELISSITTNLQNKVRISCFSESFASPLMWAHYADSGKGICVEYDIQFDKMFHSFEFGEYTRTLCCFPVLYSTKRYDATYLVEQTLLQYICGLNNVLDIDLLKRLKLALFKSSTWSYEKEWRIFASSFSTYEPVRINLSLPIIKSIILGHAMKQPQIELVKETVRSLKDKTGTDILLKRAIIDTDDPNYSIRVVEE